MYGFPNLRVSQVTDPAGGPVSLTTFPNASSDTRLVDRREPALSNLIQTNPLFGDFPLREGVASAARLVSVSPTGLSDAVLWVNFDSAESFSPAVKSHLREVFEATLSRRSDICAELEKASPFPARALTTILEATESLSIDDIGLDEYLGNVLKATLTALGINFEAGEGLGSVFRYEPRQKILYREQHFGATQPNAKTKNHVDKGEGLISWVALRRRSLLVPDLRTSPFKSSGIYVEVSVNSQSELAVPMLAGDQLVGVMNLESSLPESPFSPASVRAVWLAANHAAMAYHIARSRNHSRRFLDIVQQTTATSASGRGTEWFAAAERPMNELATLACDWLGAQTSDIWSYPSDDATRPAAVGVGMAS